MAYGVPPIVTDVGGSPELIENGISGIVIEPANPREIARAVLDLYRSEKERVTMGEEAKKRIASCFRIHTTIQETADLYRDCLGNTV